MNTPSARAVALTCAAVSALLIAPIAAQTIDRLTGKNVSIAQTTFKGRSAIQLIAAPDAVNATSYAVVKDTSFLNGTIEVDVAGQPAAGAGGGRARLHRDRVPRPGRRTLRVHLPAAHQRPGRRPGTAESLDPVQLASRFRLRQIAAGGSRKVRVVCRPRARRVDQYKIEVDGRKARLYVHGAEQPGLIVNDLKLEPRAGGVALWVGPGTEGYFSNLKITSK